MEGTAGIYITMNDADTEKVMERAKERHHVVAI